MGIMDRIVGFMMGRMSKEEKEAMMDRMMDKFLADMTPEDKQKMMSEMMPKMMINMMGWGEGRADMMGMGTVMKESSKEMEMMPSMMMEMMPQCLTMMLPKVPKEKRIDFVLKMISILVEQGYAGLSEEEKKSLVEKIVEKVKTTGNPS